MEKPNVDVNFDKERDVAVISITDGDTEVRADFDPKLLSALIDGLLVIREQMASKVPMGPPAQHQQMPGENNPAWTANLATTPAGEHKPALFFRYSGLGWRGLYLKPDTARAVADALMKLAEMADKQGVKLH